MDRDTRILESRSKGLDDKTHLRDIYTATGGKKGQGCVAEKNPPVVSPHESQATVSFGLTQQHPSFRQPLSPHTQRP